MLWTIEMYYKLQQLTIILLSFIIILFNKFINKRFARKFNVLTKFLKVIVHINFI